MLRNEDRNAEAFQHYNHPSLDVAFVLPAPGPESHLGSVDARISLPEIRVRSAISIVFEADKPDDSARVDLRGLGNEVVGYASIKGRNMVLSVGEIWGKHGIPLQFPKSKIYGIKLETQEYAQWIDLHMTLGNPAVRGRWSVYYHATSDNKLKYAEWEAYITQVTAEIMGTPIKLYYGNV